MKKNDHKKKLPLVINAICFSVAAISKVLPHCSSKICTTDMLID